MLNASTLSQVQRQILADYKLVQYDQSIGKHYLDQTSFFTIQ